MKPGMNWYEIVVPNRMIRSGQIKESNFVPDLSNVIQQSPPLDYSNPVMFFQKTYLTRGLLRLLNNVQTKFQNEEGGGIIKLQTPFGGGKTHALIAVYHYATKGTELTDYFPKVLSPLQAKVVTIVGTNLNPLEGRKGNKVRIHTIWGDIAYQIAGENGYNEFKANDENRITPGKEKIRNFLGKHEPFLLLLDEIAEYVVKARGVPVNESNLGTQTLLFIQELTEAISSLSRGLMIITLPVHKFEDFSETTLDVVNRINQILGRMETTETPLEREDLYQLITKRLIDKVLLQENRDEIISKYIQIYQKKRNVLPERIQDPSFFERMRDSYPFHPEFIDILYDKWCSLPSFQGTRAILRILTRVLTYLWSSKEELDLVQLMNVNFQETRLKNEFLRHIDPQFESIIGSDIIGSESKSSSLDKLHPEWNNLASGVSQAIFLSSFIFGGIPRGITPSELKMNLIRPQIPISLIDEILYQLNGTLHYLHNEDGRYYFSHEPNLNRKIQDIKELFQEDFEEEMRLEIKKHIGKEFTTFIWPNSSNDIPDDQELKIVLIHPSTPRNSMNKWLDRKGITFRRNKNTVIFAVSDKSHLRDLENLVQTKLALNELQERTRKTSNEKQHGISTEIIKQQERITDALSYSIRKTYSILYDGTSTISLGLPKTKHEPLTKWFRSELLAREFIVSKLHYRKLNELFLSSDQWVSTQQVLEQFYVNLNLFKIESDDIIRQAICWGVEDGAFAKTTLRNNKIQTNSFFFSTKLAPTQIIFASNEFLLSKEIAKTIASQIANNPEIEEVIIPKELEKTSHSGLIFKSTSETKIRPQKFYSLSIEVQDLESKSLPAFYRGVLVPLESKNAKISMEIKLDVKCEQEISKTIIDSTIKETITQLGARITKIKKKK